MVNRSRVERLVLDSTGCSPEIARNLKRAAINSALKILFDTVLVFGNFASACVNGPK